jgi:hypothetical protein
MSTVFFITSSSDNSKIEIGRYLSGFELNFVVTMVGVSMGWTSPGAVMWLLEAMVVRESR